MKKKISILLLIIIGNLMSCKTTYIDTEEKDNQRLEDLYYQENDNKEDLEYYEKEDH